MNKYLISSKPDDYGASNRMVIICKLKDIKNNVYHYFKISDEEYEVLKKYLGDYFDYDYDLELLLFAFMIVPILIILDIVTIPIQPVYYIAYKIYKGGDNNE